MTFLDIDSYINYSFRYVVSKPQLCVLVSLMFDTHYLKPVADYATIKLYKVILDERLQFFLQNRVLISVNTIKYMYNKLSIHLLRKRWYTETEPFSTEPYLYGWVRGHASGMVFNSSTLSRQWHAIALPF